MSAQLDFRVVIVGNREGTNVGGSFEHACCELGVPVAVLESRRAMEGPTILRHLNWQFRGHRPSRLAQFSRELVSFCREWRPTHLIATGIAPIDRQSLRELATLDVHRLNYLTDDPFSDANHSPWFLRSVLEYNVVFSPRHGNIGDLKKVGCKNVTYMPFGYAPELRLQEMPAAIADQYRSDVFFAGGADRDRIAYISALSDAKVNIGLYGAYWERYPKTRAITRGYADPGVLRLAIHGAKVSLCLVRHANRDGHSMRTFELAVSGACMLVEDSDEHRSIFGNDGEAVFYFSSIPEMVNRARWLLTNPDQRARSGDAVKRLILAGRNTYRDRLERMLLLDAPTLDSGQATEETVAGQSS